jgi:hypothetical protein
VGSNPSRDASNQLIKSCELLTTQLLDIFLKSCSSGTSPKTIRIYHIALDRFVNYPLIASGINLYLNNSTCHNAKHNYFRCVCTLCKWLYINDYIASNSIEEVSPPGKKRILQVINNSKEYYILQLMMQMNSTISM